MDDLCNYIYIVLKMLNYDDERNEIVVEQISLILGPNFVISFQEKAGDVFNHIKEQIRGKKGRIREMGDGGKCMLWDTRVNLSNSQRNFCWDIPPRIYIINRFQKRGAK